MKQLSEKTALLQRLVAGDDLQLKLIVITKTVFDRMNKETLPFILEQGIK